MKRCLTLFLFCSLSFLIRGQDTWDLDPQNSSIQFNVSHLLISSVPGVFNNFSAKIVTQKENSFDKARLEAVVKVNSIDTGNKQRDKHLLQSDFFDNATYQDILFQNAILEFTGEKSFQVTGDLTIKNITKKMVFNGVFGGYANMWGKQRAGFSATGKINRFDFGITYNDTMDSGGLIVGEEVTFTLNLEFNKQN